MSSHSYPVIPLSMALLDTKSTTGAGHWRYGLLLGLALDTAMKGGLSTLDASWQAGAWIGLVGLGLPLVLLALVQREASRAGAESPAIPDVRAALPLLVIGPFLFLELLLFQNVAQQTALIDWPQPAVLTWIVAVNGAGILAVMGNHGQAHPMARHRARGGGPGGRWCMGSEAAYRLLSRCLSVTWRR